MRFTNIKSITLQCSLRKRRLLKPRLIRVCSCRDRFLRKTHEQQWPSDDKWKCLQWFAEYLGEDPTCPTKKGGTPSIPELIKQKKNAKNSFSLSFSFYALYTYSSVCVSLSNFFRFLFWTFLDENCTEVLYSFSGLQTVSTPN